jgi:hypothetical protein
LVHGAFIAAPQEALLMKMIPMADQETERLTELYKAAIEKRIAAIRREEALRRKRFGS